MEAFWLTFASVASIHLLSVIAPGPDFVLVTGNAFVYPRRIAVYTALGIALGVLVHVTYCMLGLAVVIASSLLIFSIIKYLGAAYLFYLGFKALLSKSTTSIGVEENVKQKIPNLSAPSALKQGFLCNVLNPKATIFFLGVFSLIVKPEAPFWQQAFYGVWICLATFAWFAFLANIIAHRHSRKIVMSMQPYAIKSMGVLLILFGVALVFVSHV
jgi:RhtB (resistance to homoserine/threonine) family protein